MTPRRLTLGLLAAFAAAMTGCATPAAEPPAPARISESPAAIDVTVARRVLTMHFLAESLTPSSGQVEAFNGLLGAGDVGRGDRVVIERGAGLLADTRARLLAGALTREGLNPVVTAAADVADSELRLVVEHAEAAVRGCPDWSRPPGDHADNALPRDFGCASAVDLAAMVADPRDLVEGRPLAPVVGDAATLAIHRYRTGAPETTEGAAAVVFPDIDRPGRTTMPTAPARPQDPPAAQSPAPAAAGVQASAVVQAAGALAGGPLSAAGGQPR